MGIAIIGILFCHYNECRIAHNLEGNALSKMLAFGNCFVDVFLVLSGIGLYYSFSRDRSIIQFYKKRLRRLLPTYLIIAVPYWIYNDMFVSNNSVESVLYDLSFGSFLFNGVKRFWFVFL